MHVVGVFKDEEDVKKGPIYTPNEPGDLKFEDEDVNAYGKITTADKTIVGSPFPDFTQGLTNSFRYAKIL